MIELELSNEPIQITILHTNDMHSRLEALSRLSTYARQLRKELEEQGREVFLFDAGDAADRSVHFTGVTKGAAFPRILSAMGYDVQTLGNAISLTYGPEAAANMAARADFPVLAANFFRGDERLVDVFEPVAMFEIGQHIRLGVIGLTVQAPEIYSIFGIEMLDYREVVSHWIERLLEQGAKIIIVLSHLGLTEDRLLAETSADIEAIIGGHSHSILPEGEMINGVLIAQAGQYAEMLGQVDLAINPQDGTVISKSARLHLIPNDTPLDPLVGEAIRRATEEAGQFLARPIAVLQEPLELDHFAECRVANLAADALRERLGADAAILTSGLFHQGLPSGMVTMGNLNTACFSTANPQLSEIRGEQIIAGLERGLDPEFTNRRLKSFRGTPVGIPAVSGMTIVYDPREANGSRIKRVFICDRPLDPGRLYRIAHTDAEVISDRYEGGFLALEEGQVVKVEVPTILREAIEDFLVMYSPVPAPQGGRWVLSVG